MNPTRRGRGPRTKEQKAWGIAGNPRAVRRTIVIAAADDKLNGQLTVMTLELSAK